jgi:hypothetical protein
MIDKCRRALRIWLMASVSETCDFELHKLKDRRSYLLPFEKARIHRC